MTATQPPASIYSHLPAAEQVRILSDGLRAELSLLLGRHDVEAMMDMVGDIVDAAILQGREEEEADYAERAWESRTDSGAVGPFSADD